VREGFSRLDGKLADLEIRLGQMRDHEPRIKKIEQALATYAALSQAVVREEPVA
jgi:hypothetical protein